MKEIQIQASSEEQNKELCQLLRKYNQQYLGTYKNYNYHIEENGKIIAGITGKNKMDTLEVEYLCVDEAYRGQGLGSKLLRHVENLAMQDGIKHVLLFTYSFQAPGFYKAMGYKQQFDISPCFGEYSQIFYWKDL